MDTRITPAPSAKQPHASKLRPLKELFRKSRNTLAYVSVDGDVAKWQRQVDEEIDRFKVCELFDVILLLTDVVPGGGFDPSGAHRTCHPEAPRGGWIQQ
jgi:hypothetical protein